MTETIIGGAILAVVGAFLVSVKPETLWKLDSWKWKNPAQNEPSEKYLRLSRAVGTIFIVAGLLMCGGVIK